MRLPDPVTSSELIRVESVVAMVVFWGSGACEFGENTSQASTHARPDLQGLRPAVALWIQGADEAEMVMACGLVTLPCSRESAACNPLVQNKKVPLSFLHLESLPVRKEMNMGMHL